MKILTLEKLKKVYADGKIAVKGMDLEVSKGEVFGLLGPNGAGKTTTMKMITGALVPTAGSIYLKGENIVKAGGQKAREFKRMMGYSPERPALFQKLTPREFLTFVGELYGMEDNLLQQRIAWYLDFFSLLDSQNEYMDKFSAGMQKKITTIMAVLGDPEVILLDEPFTDLDPASIYAMKNLIKSLKGEGKAVLISTHFLALASEITDRLGIIHEGEVLFYGREKQLREKLKQPEDASLETLFLQLTGQQVQ